MSTEIRELRINASENFKRVMYLAKEFLLTDERIDIVSNTRAAPIVAHAAENLVRLKYVTYENLTTNTSIVNGRRMTKFIIRVQKTGDFKKLYDENLATRNSYKEKYNQTSTTPTPTPTTTPTPNK